jgi:hypothetical protein
MSRFQIPIEQRERVPCGSEGDLGIVFDLDLSPADSFRDRLRQRTQFLYVPDVRCIWFLCIYLEETRA